MAKKQHKYGNKIDQRKGSGNHNSNHNSKGNGKGSSKEKFLDVDVTNDCTRSNPNDVSWYAQNAQMLTDAASVAFNQMVGAPFAISQRYTTDNENSISVYKTVPGVMTLGWAPSVGVSTDGDSAINIAARNLYSYVRHANSGHSNYDPADLMMYVLAVDSAYAFHAAMVRAYGVMRFYSQTNRYLAKHLVTALGFSFEDLEMNLANFRYQINEYALKINSLAVPNSIPFFARHMWMNKGIYMDRPGIKAQLYAYRQNGYCQFTEMGSGSTIYGSLKFVAPKDPLGIYELTEFANSLINPIIGSEAMNIMSGDILKAFGSSGILTVPAIPEDYVVIPEYNMEVLHQMHNFHAMGAIHTTDEYITQDPAKGIIVHNPKVARSSEWRLSSRFFLDMHVDSPTAADVMVSSRMMGWLGSFVEDEVGVHIFGVRACGSEIPCNIRVWYIDPSKGELLDFSFENEIAIDEGIDTKHGAFIPYISTFDMHPTLYPHQKGLETTISMYLPVGDLDNFVGIETETLKRMHECALLSELAVPSMGVFNESRKG